MRRDRGVAVWRHQPAVIAAVSVSEITQDVRALRSESPPHADPPEPPARPGPPRGHHRRLPHDDGHEEKEDGQVGVLGFLQHDYPTGRRQELVAAVLAKVEPPLAGAPPEMAS